MVVLVRSILLFALAAGACLAQASPLFDTDEVLQVELKGPLSSLVKDKASREERAFELRVDGVTLDLKVRPRGNSRLRVCTFPPLRLDFRSTDTADTVFAGQGKLKLVTQCRNGKRSQQDVLEEYAAYRILTLLSEVSYRVRLAHIAYIDTDSRGGTAKQQYGFFIEPVKQLAARVDGLQAEVPAVSLKSLNQQQAALVYIFQYLIGNTDWSLVTAESDEHCCHNVDLIDIDSKRYLVPYDFDLTGLVNSSYAQPDPSLRIRNVQQRLYRGFCTDNQVLRNALQKFVSNREDILGVILGLPLLSEKEKSKRADYLDKFFDEASDVDAMAKSLEKSCHT